MLYFCHDVLKSLDGCRFVNNVLIHCKEHYAFQLVFEVLKYNNYRVNYAKALHTQTIEKVRPNILSQRQIYIFLYMCMLKHARLE
jgi:hypothetical protein